MVELTTLMESWVCERLPHTGDNWQGTPIALRCCAVMPAVVLCSVALTSERPRLDGHRQQQQGRDPDHSGWCLWAFTAPKPSKACCSLHMWSAAVLSSCVGSSTQSARKRHGSRASCTAVCTTWVEPGTVGTNHTMMQVGTGRQASHPLHKHCLGVDEVFQHRPMPVALVSACA